MYQRLVNKYYQCHLYCTKKGETSCGAQIRYCAISLVLGNLAINGHWRWPRKTCCVITYWWELRRSWAISWRYWRLFYQGSSEVLSSFSRKVWILIDICGTCSSKCDKFLLQSPCICQILDGFMVHSQTILYFVLHYYILMGNINGLMKLAGLPGFSPLVYINTSLCTCNGVPSNHGS